MALSRSLLLVAFMLGSTGADNAVSTASCQASNWVCTGGLSSAMAAWCGQVVGSANCQPTCAVGASSMSSCAACILNMYAMTSSCSWGNAGTGSTAVPSSTTFPSVTTTTAPAPASTTLTTAVVTPPPGATTTSSAATARTTTTFLSTKTSTAVVPASTTTTKAAVTQPPTTAPTTTCAGGQGLLPSSRRVVYIDYRDINWSSPTSTVTAAVDAGYNVIVLAFLLSSSAADMAGAWMGVGAAAQVAAMSYVHSKCAVVMVSAGGATDMPWTTFASGASYGSYAGQWAQSNNLDGVDFDFENLAPGFIAGSFAGTRLAQYLADASIAAKKFVKLVSHAPQAPYFGAVGSATAWPGTSGGYSSVEALANGAVDFYNVQFYNQGPTCYTTYAGLFTSSASDCSVFPGTSVKEIASYGVPPAKITVTKYLITDDGSNGYVSATALNGFLRTAETAGIYTGGASCWAYAASSSSSWIAAVCSGGVC